MYQRKYPNRTAGWLPPDYSGVTFLRNETEKGTEEETHARFPSEEEKEYPPRAPGSEYGAFGEREGAGEKKETKKEEPASKPAANDTYEDALFVGLLLLTLLRSGGDEVLTMLVLMLAMRE